MKLTYIVQNNKYLNVKEILKAEFSLSDRLIANLKNKEQIFLNNEKTFVSKLVKPKDKIEVFLDFEEESNNIIPTKFAIPIAIFFLSSISSFIYTPIFLYIILHPWNVVRM